MDSIFGWPICLRPTRGRCISKPSPSRTKCVVGMKTRISHVDFDGVDIIAACRRLDWNSSSGRAVEDLNFSAL